MNAPPAEQSIPSARLLEYLGAFAARDSRRVVSCFLPHGSLELPMMRPGRLVGAGEIAAAHTLAFENLEKVILKTHEVADSDGAAMICGELEVTCRGKEEIHAFAIASEGTAQGLSRVSWYFDSRRHRYWSDKAVL
jgi:hypothetical protein